MTYSEMFFMGLILNLCLMTIIWIISYAKKNAGIVDVAWGSGIALVAVFYGVVGEASLGFKAMAVGLTGIWAARLSIFLYMTRVKGTSHEDPRYTDLRDSWKSFKNLKMFGFFLFQGLVGCIFSIPALILSQSQKPSIGVLEIIGVWIWACAVLGETFADSQLAQFKANSNNKGKVCNVGLWKYSRHPNYFFESLVWCGMAFACFQSNLGFLGLLCPVLMFFFLFKVTGISATEAQALKSKGDAYREYQKRTSVFVPWFPKKGET